MEIGRATGDNVGEGFGLIDVVTHVIVKNDYLKENYLSSDSELRNSQSSSVLSTLTLACSLSNFSSDQMQSDSNLSATAKYSMSLACGEISLA